MTNKKTKKEEVCNEKCIKIAKLQSDLQKAMQDLTKVTETKFRLEGVVMYLQQEIAKMNAPKDEVK